MSEVGTQQDYWNSRAVSWGNYDAPLILGEAEIHFMKSQLVPGGDALVLGATPQLTEAALQVSGSVTAVDFATDVINALAIHDVNYVCADWNRYLEEVDRQFDNIMTDGGLLCLEFPSSWQTLAQNIHNRLRPNGVFAARVYVSTDQAPKDTYDNPNLARFIKGVNNVDENWMLNVKTHDDYKSYDVRYAFPPESEVLSTFSQFSLRGKFVPGYEEGERFVSYSWTPV